MRFNQKQNRNTKAER